MCKGSKILSCNLTVKTKIILIRFYYSAVFISITAYSRSLPRMKEVGNNYMEFPTSINSSTESTNSVSQKIPWLSLSSQNALLAVFISPKLSLFLANAHQDQHFVRKIYFQPDFKMWIHPAFFFFITTAIRYCRGFILLHKP